MCNVMFLKLCVASLVLWVGIIEGATSVMRSKSADSIGQIKEPKVRAKSVVRSVSIDSTGGQIDDRKGRSVVRRVHAQAENRDDHRQRARSVQGKAGGGNGEEATGRCVKFSYDAAPNPIPAEIFGYNQINGPVFQILYNDSRLMEIPKVLWAGQLRFPGGTVANYWSLSNGTYLDQTGKPECASADGKNEQGVKKCYRKDKLRVDAMGSNVFTPNKFLDGFGSASPVKGTSGPLWDLNVLTLEGEDIKQQIDHLNSMQTNEHSNSVKWIEFGNELFMSRHYSSTFPDAQSYIDRIKEGLNYTKTKFPNAKVAVPMAYPFCTGRCGQWHMGPWNQILVNNQDLFDAVTIHDYTACTKSIDGTKSDGTKHYTGEAQKTSAVLAWGEVAIENQLACAVQSGFQNKEIWMSEWNYASFVKTENGHGLPFQDEGHSGDKVANSVTSGIFRASYLLAMLGSSVPSSNTNYYTAAHTQHLNEVDGQAHGSNAGVTRVFSDGLYINAVGQIMSHISYIALSQSDGTFKRVTVTGVMGVTTLEHSVTAAEVAKSSIQCVSAIQFNTAKWPILVAINRCQAPVNIDIGLGWARKLLRSMTYRAGVDSNWTPIANLPSDYSHPWLNGPSPPEISTSPILGDRMNITLVPQSLTVIDRV